MYEMLFKNKNKTTNIESLRIFENLSVISDKK